MRPFRFGVNMWHGPTRAEWAAKARRVEDLGFDTLTVPDHLTDLMAPMPAALAAADATKHLRIGTNVLNNDLRHPLLVAREAATIDVLSNGRFQLGLGAGSIQAEYQQAGIAFDSGGTRVARLGEAVTIIKGLLASENVTFAGRHYQVTGHAIAPLPLQRPLPILIGGNGPRLLTLAAHQADIVGLSGITFRPSGAPPDLSAWKVSAVEQRVQLIRNAAGERCDRIELNVLVQRVVITEDRHGAAEELTRRWPQLSVDDILASPYVLIGTVDQIAEHLQVRRERWGFSYYVVFEPYIDAFAPVVARLAGE